MAVDTPARIAILGAGPIGLESALYARFLGYDVDIYERSRVADNVLSWGHVRMFSPFGMNRSSLGLAAIVAQDESYQPPSDDEILTGRQWADRYLVPLANTDLLSDQIHANTTVIAVGKEGVLKQDLFGNDERGDWPFRLLLRTAVGEQIKHADVVIDTTGVYGHANWLGTGGLPAVGEFAGRDQIEYGLPDVLAAERDTYASRHTLVIGAGHSAATTITALATLAREVPGTRATWVTRCELTADAPGPVVQIADDRLPERAHLARVANACVRDAAAHVTHFANTTVEAIRFEAGSNSFRVELGGAQAASLQADRVVANVGYRPDRDLYGELQVHECYATGGPMNLAAALMKQTSTDCLDQRSGGVETLLTPEPHFYVLGAKSYGRRSNFLVSVGLEQIRNLFRIIGDRPTLDLYDGPQHLPR